jgi:hypothetical protein
MKAFEVGRAVSPVELRRASLAGQAKLPSHRTWPYFRASCHAGSDTAVR